MRSLTEILSLLEFGFSPFCVVYLRPRRKDHELAPKLVNGFTSATLPLGLEPSDPSNIY